MGSKSKAKDLAKLTRLELYELAKELNIKGRSTLSKNELIDLIAKLRGKLPIQPPAPKTTPQPRRAALNDRFSGEPPRTYGETSLVLQVRDPYWAHAYWEIDDQARSRLRKTLGEDAFAKGRFVLRVYDITDVKFDGHNAHGFFDNSIFVEANSWYLQLGHPARTFIADLGFIAPGGKFHLVCRGNSVETPPDSFSTAVDETWMVADEKFQQIYQASGGFETGKSSGELQQAMAQRFHEELSSGARSSLSLSSPVRKDQPSLGKNFWLDVNTELVVYGSTEPNSRLSIQGKEVQLRPDGTFSIRFALPDGEQEIPVRAVNSNADIERTITPIVHKITR